MPISIKELSLSASRVRHTDYVRLRKEWFLLLVRELFDPGHGKNDLLLTNQTIS